MSAAPSGAFFQPLARTGEPRRLSGALSLALPGFLSARLIPGLGKQLLPWQVTLPQLRAHSKPDSATQPAKACQEAGGPLSILSQETPWKEGCSCSCWEDSGTPEAVLGLGYPHPTQYSACCRECSLWADQGVLCPCQVFLYFPSEK